MSRDTKIKDIKIIRSNYDPNSIELEQKGLAVIGSEGCIPKNRDYIPLYADEPCVEACQKLYDLNIETYTSGGHVDGKENATSSAYIGIVYDTLSDENKLIANYLIEKGIIQSIENNQGRGQGNTISISIPIHSDDLVGDVSDKLLLVANEFKQQDVLYARYTYEELRSEYYRAVGDNLYRDFLTFESIDGEEADIRMRACIDAGYIPAFSNDGNLFFKTEDLLNKHNSYVESKSISIKSA